MCVCVCACVFLAEQLTTHEAKPLERDLAEDGARNLISASFNANTQWEMRAREPSITSPQPCISRSQSQPVIPSPKPSYYSAAAGDY